jgi:hypothetical protein
MIRNNYSFFGVNTHLELKETVYQHLLIDELKPYNIDNNDIDVVISDDYDTFKDEILYKNPSTHFDYKSSITFKLKQLDVTCVFKNEKLIKIYFRLNEPANYFRKVIQKWINIQFTNRVENFGQIFHENILGILILLHQNLIPIHASAMYDLKTKKSVVFGGTGGVGKTTIELLLGISGKFSFIADDIVVFNTEKGLMTNHNWPKIYGYNVIGNKPLKNKILSKSIFDKIHWYLHEKIFGSNRIRRKISPQYLYDKVETRAISIDNYFILSRNNNEKILIDPLGVDSIVAISVQILKTELDSFLSHIYWHEINHLTKGTKPLITVDLIVNKWKKGLSKALCKSKCQLINIPIDMKHSEFKDAVSNLFLK